MTTVNTMSPAKAMEVADALYDAAAAFNEKNEAHTVVYMEKSERAVALATSDMPQEFGWEVIAIVAKD